MSGRPLYDFELRRRAVELYEEGHGRASIASTAWCDSWSNGAAQERIEWRWACEQLRAAIHDESSY